MTITNVPSSAIQAPQIQIGKAAAAAEESSFFGQILDIVNPLQHIPLISNLYRNLTGDKIDAFAHIAGGAIFGGPLGAAGAAASEIVKAGLNGETTQTAFTDTKQATEAYTKPIRATTADWLNPNFDTAA
jgi:hypothetical protein